MSHHLSHRSVSCLFIALVCFSCSKVNRNNPYDPAAPDTVKAQARVIGQVQLEGPGLLADVVITATQVRAGADAGRRVDGKAQEDGKFVLEAAPSNYNVVVSMAGHQSVTFPALNLSPGDEYDLGTVNLLVAKGSVSGDVFLQSATREDAPGEGAEVFLSRADGLGGVYTARTRADGHFEADGLPAGDYIVRARLPEYAPAYTPDPVTVVGSGAAVAPDLRLYPASAVVHFSNAGILSGAFTATQSVDVELFAFVNFLTDMRVSEDPTFANAALGDTAFRTYATSIPWTLSDAEGPHTVYAQFRDKGGIESDVFKATITLDRIPPNLISLGLNQSNGFVTTSLAEVTLGGNDDTSGIAKYQVSLSADFSGAPERSATGNNLVIPDTVALGADGAKTIYSRLIDRAGNVSASKSISTFKDTQAPTTTSPVMVIGDGSGTVYDLSVSLTLQANSDRPNEQLFVALANAPGLSLQSPRQLFETNVVTHTLANGADGLRTVCVMFSDAANNSTNELCQNVTLSRSGALHGVVSFEGIPANDPQNAGVSVTLANAFVSTSIPAATTDSSGAFLFPSAPAGSGYLLTIARAGYETVVDQDITIVAGLDQNRGSYEARIARGTVSGRVTLADKSGNQHGGIVVSDVLNPSVATVTGPDGTFSFLAPAGTRTFAASNEDYLSAEFPVVTVVSNGTHPLGSLSLARQTGDFRVCKKIADDPTCATTILYTRDLTVGLALSYPNAVAYYASESSTPPATADDVVTPFGTGNVDFTLAAGADGARSLYVWIKDNTNTVSPRFSSSLTVDTTPPVLSNFSIDDDALYSTHVVGDVVLHVSASDAYSGVDELHISNEDNDFTDPLDRNVQYAALTTHTLVNTDGLRTVFIELCDVVGNCSSSPASDTITLDRAPPSAGTGVTFAIDANAVYTTTPFVSLSIDAGDAVGVRYGSTASLDTLSFSQLVPGANEVPYSLLGADGLKEVFAQFVDLAGNVSTPAAFSDTITLDRIAPSASSVSINAGLYTNVRPLTLTLSASDATHMLLHVGTSEDFSLSSWVPYATSDNSLTLPISEGTYTVYVRFADAAGNQTNTVTDTITYDTSAPTLSSVSYAINAAPDGNKYSKPGPVAVDFFALAADRMRVAEDGVLDVEAAIAYATRRTVTLPATSGARPIVVSYSDFAGNSIASPVSDTVYIDNDAPTGSVAISQGAYTNTANVLLALTYSDALSGVDAVAIANGATCTGASFESVSSLRTFTIPSTQGSKTVAVCFRDRVGNVTTPYTATTIVDTIEPSTVSLELSSGATHIANTAAVPVRLTAIDTNPMEYQLSEDPNFSDVSAWTTLATSPFNTTFTLSSGDGNKTLHLRVRDAAGNLSSASDSVILDSEDPYAPSLVLSPTTFTNTRVGITASFSAVGATQRCLYGDFVGAPVDNCVPASAGWTSLSTTSTTLTLTTVNGTKTVYAVFRDDALRTSAVSSDSLVFDDTSPNVTAATVTLTGLAKDGVSTARTRTSAVSVALAGFASSDALSGVTEMQVSEDNTFNGIAWQPLAAAFPWVLSSGDASKDLYVRVRDNAANVSSFRTGTILLDTSPPSLSLTIIGEGANATATSTMSRRRDVTLAVTASDGTGSGVVGSDMQLARDASFSGASFQTYAASPSFDLVDPAIATCRQRIHLNEVSTNTAVPLELHNTFAASMNLSGWKIECGNNATSITATLANVVLGPDAYIPVNNGAGTSSKSNLYLGATCPFVSGGPGYAILKDANDVVVDYVKFNSSTHTAPSAEWSSGSVTCAPSCGRTQLAFDRNLATDWCAQAASLGSENVSTCSLIANDCASIDGVAAAFVKVRDLAGNEASAGASTVLDVTPAIGNLTINADATYAVAEAATLQLFGFDGTTGVSDVAVSLSPTTLTNFQTYSSTLNINLAASEGEQTVYAVFRDAAGNDSPAFMASDLITYDTTEPTLGTVTLTGLDRNGSSNTLTRTTAVLVTLGSVAGDPIEMIISEDSGFDGAIWQPRIDAFPWILVPGDGSKTLYVKLRDLAGNTSATFTGTIILDQTAPDGGAVIVNGNDAYTNSLFANVLFKIGGGAVDYSFDNTAWVGCVACSATTFSSATATLTTDQGSQKVQMYFRDSAGNVSNVFDDDIFVDTLQPPSPPVITAVSPKTTSVFLDFSDVQDDTSVANGSSGIASYQVEVLSQQGATVASATFTTSEGTITGLPALEIYGFRVRAFDRAGNNSTNSQQFTSQVGLSTSVIDSFGNLGAMGDRATHYRGVTMFPRIITGTTSGGPAFLLCDARRKRCQDAGIQAGTDRNIFAPAATEPGVFEFAPTAVGDSVYGVFSIHNGGSTKLFVTRMTGSADLLLGGNNWTTSSYMSETGTQETGSLQLTSNGKVLFMSHWVNAGGVRRLVGRFCPLTSNCLSITNWLAVELQQISTPTSPHFPIYAERLTGQPKSATVSAEAGERHLWVAYPSMDNTNGAQDCNQERAPGQNDTCGFTVMGCDAVQNDCTSQANWTTTRLRATSSAEPGSLGFAHSVALLETQGKLNVLALESPAPNPPPSVDNVKRGLYLWQCTTGTQCDAAADFGTPGLVQKIFQPISLGLNGESPPRVAFEAWGGYLHLAAVDYSTGVVFHSRCYPGLNDCSNTNGWTRSNVLTSGDIRGQATMAIAHGNPLLLVGRDPARAFLVEPNTPAPMQRSIVPSFINNGVISSWSPRASDAADGFRVDTNTSEWGSSATSFSLAPDSSYSEVRVSSSANETRYGTVTAYRGVDTSLDEPVFAAKQEGRINWYNDVGIDDNSTVVAPPDRQPDDRHCLVYAFKPSFATGGALNLLTCPKASNCAEPSNWRTGSYSLPATGGHSMAEYAIDAVSNPSTGGAAYVAYVTSDNAGSPHGDLRYAKINLGADCAPAGALAATATLELDNPVGAPSERRRPQYVSVSKALGRVFVAYRRTNSVPEADGLRMTLASCTLGGTCDSGSFATSSWPQNYLGGPISEVTLGGVPKVAWLAQLVPMTSEIGTYFMTCRPGVSEQDCCKAGDVGCANTTSWNLMPAAGAAQMVAPTNAQNMSYADLRSSISGNKLLLATDRYIAWCDTTAAGACEQSKHWTRSAFSPEILAVAQLARGTLSYGDNRFVYTGFGTDGSAIATCNDRCWKQDNWHGGFTNKNPEMGASLGAPGYGFGGNAYINSNLAVTSAFAYRVPTNPFSIGIGVIQNASFAVCNKRNDPTCPALP